MNFTRTTSQATQPHDPVERGLPRFWQRFVSYAVIWLLLLAAEFAVLGMVFVDGGKTVAALLVAPPDTAFLPAAYARLLAGHLVYAVLLAAVYCRLLERSDQSRFRTLGVAFLGSLAALGALAALLDALVPSPIRPNSSLLIPTILTAAILSCSSCGRPEQETIAAS